MDDIMKGVLPNKKIMMAYISTQYKNMKGRKHIKANIRKSCDMESLQQKTPSKYKTINKEENWHRGA